ncbi:hypothetical protein FRC01_006878 [Tulasnella sp. 417]|nr:hypothetical protein FRC01_006878 [Tulasnella sp. 417]
MKSLNILVSASCRAVITDFGSARILGETGDRLDDGDNTTPEATRALTTAEYAGISQITLVACSTGLTLTGPAWSLRWAAPEVAMGKRQDLASDIWAAGWVCWEIMTDKVPFPELSTQGIITLKVMQGEVPVARDDTNLSQITRLCSLMEDCWIFDSTKRPDVARCNNELKRMPSIPPFGGKSSDSKGSSPEILYQKGRLHSGQGDLPKAVLLFEQMLAKTSASDQDARGRGLFELGRANYLMSNYSDAEQHLTQAQGVFAQIGNDAGRANASCWLAKMYRRQAESMQAEESSVQHRRQAKFTQAEELLTEAVAIYSRIGDDKERASALRALGNIFHDRAQYPEAKKLYNQALVIYDGLGDVRGRANTLRGLGKLRQDCSEYQTAEESFNEARDIFNRIGDNIGLASVTQCLGDLFRVQGLNNKAALLFTEAIRLYKQVGDSKMVEYCTNWLEAASKRGDSSTTLAPGALAGDGGASSPSRQQ